MKDERPARERDVDRPAAAARRDSEGDGAADERDQGMATIPRQMLRTWDMEGVLAAVGER